MIASFNLCGIQIKQRLQQLTAVWQELKETAQFLAKIDEEEAWISEQQQLLTIPDLGDNMAAVQGLLKKHDAFETDISVHGDRCSDIFKLIDERNHHADSITQRCEQLRNKMYNLGELANVRKSNLLDNYAYLQFKWKAEIIQYDRAFLIAEKDKAPPLSQKHLKKLLECPPEILRSRRKEYHRAQYKKEIRTNIVNMRKANWVKRREEAGPRTIKKIHNDTKVTQTCRSPALENIRIPANVF